MPLLVDSGPSPRGWSYYQPYFRCLKLGGLLRAGLLDDRSDALTRGTMGHIGLGHLHLRWMAQQQGKDAGMYYDPESAIEAWCERHPEGNAHKSDMIETIRRYTAKFRTPPGQRILGVEMAFSAVLGHKAGAFGLWALDANSATVFNESWRPGHPPPIAVDGQPVAPACLPSSEPIRVTRKLDLVYEEGRGNVCVRDFKCTAGDVSASRADAYAMDGQFAVTRIIAAQVWGARFGFNTIQLVKTNAPWTVKAHTVPATPWRDALFPQQLYQKAHEIEHWKNTNVHHHPMAQHEQVCRGRYEKDGCPGQGFCGQGPGWRPV